MSLLIEASRTSERGRTARARRGIAAEADALVWRDLDADINWSTRSFRPQSSNCERGQIVEAQRVDSVVRWT
jgi:hypothetical protein